MAWYIIMIDGQLVLCKGLKQPVVNTKLFQKTEIQETINHEL